MAISSKSGSRRGRRDVAPYPSEADLEQMLSPPVEIIVNTSMTRVKEKRRILTLLQSHRHTSAETYKLFGDGKHKFRLHHDDNNQVSISFQHKVVKTRTYKLVLMVADGSKMNDVLLLPIEIKIVP